MLQLAGTRNQKAVVRSQQSEVRIEKRELEITNHRDQDEIR